MPRDSFYDEQGRWAPTVTGPPDAEHLVKSAEGAVAFARVIGQAAAAADALRGLVAQHEDVLREANEQLAKEWRRANAAEKEVARLRPFEAKAASLEEQGVRWRDDALAKAAKLEAAEKDKAALATSLRQVNADLAAANLAALRAKRGKRRAPA